MPACSSGSGAFRLALTACAAAFILAELVEPEAVVESDLTDRDDLPVLGTLQAALRLGWAQTLVTGDKDLLTLPDRDPIRTAAACLAEQGGLGTCSMEAATRCGCIQLGSRGTPSARAAACRALSRLARGRPRRNASSR